MCAAPPPAHLWQLLSYPITLVDEEKRRPAELQEPSRELDVQGRHACRSVDDHQGEVALLDGPRGLCERRDQEMPGPSADAARSNVRASLPGLPLAVLHVDAIVQAGSVRQAHLDAPQVARGLDRVPGNTRLVIDERQLAASQPAKKAGASDFATYPQAGQPNPRIKVRVLRGGA